MSPVVAPLLAVIVLGIAAAVLAAQRSAQRSLVGRVVTPRPGRTPDILYFTNESCTICHVAQRPALARLRTELTDVDIREVDIAVEPDIARTYQVMTLPTTVVLDAGGRVAAVNPGFAATGVLASQVQSARAATAEVAAA